MPERGNFSRRAYVNISSTLARAKWPRWSDTDITHGQSFNLGAVADHRGRRFVQPSVGGSIVLLFARTLGRLLRRKLSPRPTVAPQSGRELARFDTPDLQTAKTLLDEPG
jgi:hypothetical protein